MSYQQPQGPYQQPQGPYQQQASNAGYSQSQYANPYNVPNNVQNPYPGAQNYNSNPYDAPRQPRTLTGIAVSNLSSNVVACLSYAFLWIGAIICLAYKRDHFVRFHAVQSLLFFGGLTVLRIVCSVIYYSIDDAFLDIALPLVFNLIPLLGVVAWVVLMIMAFQGKYFRIPGIAPLAQKYADRTAR